MGDRPERPHPAQPPAIAERGGEGLRLAQVALDVLVEAIAVELLDRLRDPRVQGAPPVGLDAAVGDVLGERVLERELDLGEHARLPEELGVLPPPQVLAQRGLGPSRHGAQQGERYLGADDRGRLQHLPESLVEAVAAIEDDVLHGVGHGHGVEAGREHHLLAVVADHALLPQRAHQLLDEERVALGLGQHERESRSREGAARSARRRSASYERAR